MSENTTSIVKDFHQLVGEGEIEKIKTLLEANPEFKIDEMDEHGLTPLQQAAYRGKSDVCSYLLSCGADVNAKEKQHSYNALMFAALSGHMKTVEILLAVGADSFHSNSVGRNASQMAAFVGRHQIASKINNYLHKSFVDYYTVPRGFEEKPKLSKDLTNSLHEFILNVNLHPVKLCLFLEKHTSLLGSSGDVVRVLELMCSKFMKESEFCNEVLSFKVHYLSVLLKAASESYLKHDNQLTLFIKQLLMIQKMEGFCENQENLIRKSFREFPYAECQLLQSSIKILSNVPMGGNPSALSVLHANINGQGHIQDEDTVCWACGDLFAEKRCTACKKALYCSRDCQKLHWFIHKKFCSSSKNDQV